MTAASPDQGTPGAPPFPIRGGVFVAVAGPSGAGKDTLIGHARRHFAHGGAEVCFVRRVVTRQAEGAGEDHDTLSREEFERRSQAGAFACSWEAHGLCYGLPASLDGVIAGGGVAVANVSRAVIEPLASRYADVMSVIVTARDDILAARLATRGRERGEEIERRLARNAAYAPGREAVGDSIVIDNSGTAEEGGRLLIAAIGKALARSAIPDRA